MNYKYLILILLVTVSMQAAPKVFNLLGSDVESFQKDCKVYQGISSLPVKAKKQCDMFNVKISNAFKVGYKLDSYADSDNVSEKKLDKYLALLRQLDEDKENIIQFVSTEKKKARNENNIKYYSQLIANNKIQLYSSDYKFMEKNKDVFNKNERYLSHLQYLKDLEERRKSQPKEKSAPILVNSLTIPQKNLVNSLTVSQKNAVRSAKNYLSFSGFSRDGLIQQLSSDAGDGYKITDARVAVDSLKIDWNKQAVRSAKNYLSFSGFSCKKLIQQLSSDAGSKYTISQATYGARQVGVCQ